jgi:molybdopterin-containing oxidoreductase family iron-sulfur binding subunit
MSPIELIARVLGDQPRKGHDIVRATFASIHGNGDAESAWRKTLHDGLLENSHAAAAPTRVQVEPWADRFKAHLQARADAQLPQLELVFVESAGVYDGRFANSGWLQEMPDSLSKLTWDNALLISPLTARELDLKLGDMLSVANGSRVVELPVYPLPGQAEGSLSVALGYGRRDCGSVGQAVGFDVYPLRTISSMNRVDVRVERVPGHHELSTTQDHHAIDPLGQREREERAHHLVRELEVDSFRENPHAVQDFEHALPPVELWQPKQYTGHKWGMSIDLNACIGCNACMIACQAENNIPVVGKQEVINGREMHWIRVDRYFSGEVDDPSVVYQPVACHHCEDAPCEQVCPVAATVHDKEGLNVMVYNRCIGTRYCANNCPFKVRRFNYFNNAKGQTPLRQMANNPEVTVRTRGVMEKCTYCVQRINSVKIQAKNERRPVRDGEITPACAQVCPTRAIVFGDLNDPESRVARRQADRRSYAMLEETQIKPRTRYMARLRNRSPRGGGGHSGAA